MGRTVRKSHLCCSRITSIFSLPQTQRTLYTVYSVRPHPAKTSGIVPARLLGTQQKWTQHPVRGLENACGIGRAVVS